jgi:hypothetical protein
MWPERGEERERSEDEGREVNRVETGREEEENEGIEDNM